MRIAPAMTVQIIVSVLRDDAIDDHHERAGRSADLPARAAERGDQKARDDRRVESSLGRHSRCDGESKRQRQRTTPTTMPAMRSRVSDSRVYPSRRQTSAVGNPIFPREPQPSNLRNVDGVKSARSSAGETPKARASLRIVVKPGVL